MHVEIWSDIACPWCYVGKRRFEAALAGFEHRDAVQVIWRSFELDPSSPPVRGGDRAVHLAEKYGSTRAQAEGMQDQMTAVAAGEGIDFRFDIAHDGNTFDAHRLLHLAAGEGVQDRLKERLFRAYLTEGQVMSDPKVLERLAVEAGLAGDEARGVLSTDRFAAGVRDDERVAKSLGISAVPFFVVDRAMGAAGAQSPEVLRALLERGWAARSPLTVVTGGDGCGVDGC